MSSLRHKKGAMPLIQPMPFLGRAMRTSRQNARAYSVAMTVRTFDPSDLEPLYRLYLLLARKMPPHPITSLDQFSVELGTTRYQEDERWDPGDHLALVATAAGEVVAFAHVSYLLEDALYSGGKTNEGMVRFLFCAPDEGDAMEAVLAPMVERARKRECPTFRALASHGPLFHNCGCGALSNAWPWVGRALFKSGFETEGRPALGMRCDLTNGEHSQLPSGAEYQEGWTTRIGLRDESEGGLHIYVGEDRAAETMWHFGEKYVEGAGNNHAHLFWLGTNNPHRGRGLGRSILRETLARVYDAGARTSDLRCDPNNFYAHALYRAEGYEPVDLLWSFRLREGT
jgi:GNAT superfamily N-acetyltransferase